MPAHEPPSGLRIAGAVWILSVALALVPVVRPALAADPEEGRAIAQRWCSSCHAIEPGAPSGEGAPPFDVIVGKENRSAEWLSTWLSVPHKQMPNFTLSRQEIAALVAYFDSLRQAN